MTAYLTDPLEGNCTMWPPSALKPTEARYSISNLNALIYDKALAAGKKIRCAAADGI
ncbi:hypothetical protein [Daejeonella sp.]|uniref:hypothetical protein n=1 Tax=Daejeonella sp. TaxID=2805397 RepID=UPI0030C1CBBD